MPCVLSSPILFVVDIFAMHLTWQTDRWKGEQRDS